MGIFTLFFLLTMWTVYGGEVEERRAFRLHLEKDPSGAIQAGLGSEDYLIRKRAVYALYEKEGRKAVGRLQQLVQDKNEKVADMLFAIAAELKQNANDLRLLEALAKQSSMPDIRRKARRMISFNFHRENICLRDNPTYDHEVVLDRAIDLPLNGWRFHVDFDESGHKKQWFDPAFNDSRWKILKIGDWESQGFPGYDGVAWYRFRFKMPEKPVKCAAVELFFRAVDESAWVWLNGHYIGQHDIGPGGWNKPFRLDVTRELKWGGENCLAVRVEDTTLAGGIWKMVSVEILK